MSTRVNSGVSAPSASEVITLTGWGNQYLKEDTLMMSDDAKIVSGDNVELGGTLVKSGGDYLGSNAVKASGDVLSGDAIKAAGDYLSGSVKVGDNSSYLLTAMDDNTESILDQALTTVALNANNMMSLAAGRDPNKALADESNAISAKAKASNSLKLAGYGILALIIIFIWKGKK